MSRSTKPQDYESWKHRDTIAVRRRQDFARELRERIADERGGIRRDAEKERDA